MKIFAAFPSKYLKAADLHDQQVQAVMSHVMLEELQNKDGTELCPILYFNGVPKGMVLNKTNAKTIAIAYSDETDLWGGKAIILFPAMVAFGAETVEAIRLKAPPPRQGGPTSRERQEAVIAAAHDPHAAAELMHDAWAQRNADALRNAMRSNHPAPAARLLNEALSHDADGVVWEETAERPMTEADKAELSNSLLRSNAALETRRVLRGAAVPDDGMDIPEAFRRPRAVNEAPTKIGRPSLADIIAAR